jgi:hypothetical protein
VRSAKLFTVVAVAVFVAALLTRYGLLHGTLGVHMFAVSIGPTYWMGFATIVCASLALCYFAVARSTAQPASELLGIISFALIALALIVMIAGNAATDQAGPQFDTLVWMIIAAMFAFLVGVVLSAVNLAWAVFRHALAPSH